MGTCSCGSGPGRKIGEGTRAWDNEAAGVAGTGLAETGNSWLWVRPGIVGDAKPVGGPGGMALDAVCPGAIVLWLRGPTSGGAASAAWGTARSTGVQG